MSSQRVQIVRLPESASEISKLAEASLRKADAIGKLPVPIEDLIRAANITEETDSEDILHRFVSTLSENGKSIWTSVRQKLRGIADIRERAIYVPSDTRPRELFAKTHELGHEVIPWHRVISENYDPFYQDDEDSLSQMAQDIFDIEANYFASEVIFQGKRFVSLARDYRPSFDAVFSLADLHGASKHATLHRYVQSQDEPVAFISYYPSRYYVDNKGFPVLRSSQLAGSDRFVRKHGDIEIPSEIRSDHDWAKARELNEKLTGQVILPCGGIPINFEWHAWWNRYALLVMLRRRPALHLIGKLLNRRSA